MGRTDGDAITCERCGTTTVSWGTDTCLWWPAGCQGDAWTICGDCLTEDEARQVGERGCTAARMAYGSDDDEDLDDLDDGFDDGPLFLIVPKRDRDRVERRADVAVLRRMIVELNGNTAVCDIADWLRMRDVRVSVSSMPDLDTVRWLNKIGGPELAAKLDADHARAGLPPVSDRPTGAAFWQAQRRD